VRLEVEMKPLGVPFDGTGLETSAFANTGVPGVEGSAISFLQTVSGLAPGTLYRWRLRIASDSPFFPRSPWLWHSGNAVTEGDVRTGGEPTGIADGTEAPTAGTWLGAPAPNPFVTATELAYTLPRAGRVEIAVYDVTGREVAVLAHGPRQPGRYTARWDGRDGGGRNLPAGVYFARLEFAGRMEAQKIVIAP
jgi:hypothetical protein